MLIYGPSIGQEVRNFTVVGFWGPQRVVVATGVVVGVVIGTAAVVMAFVVIGGAVVAAFVVVGGEIVVVVDAIATGPFIVSVIVLINLKGTPWQRPLKSSVSIDHTIDPPKFIDTAYSAYGNKASKSLKGYCRLR